MSRVQMVENNYGSLQGIAVTALSGYKACYERAGYRELWSKHELAAKRFFSESNVFVALPRGSNRKLCYCLLLKTSVKLYTALGFDTDKSSASKLEGCRFRGVGSAYASRCTPFASPKP